MSKSHNFKKVITSSVTLALILGTLGMNTQMTKAAPAANYNYGEALQKSLMFYEFQKSGKLPDNQRNNWRGDSALKDGSDVGLDLTGGWFDAGDHVKFNLPMAYTAAMLSWSYLEDKDVYSKTGQDKYILDEIKWANDYLIKCHPTAKEYYFQVGDGRLDHNFWGAAEIMPMARPAYKVDVKNGGSAVCAEAAASLASAAIVFKESDPAYAATCIKHAKELYALAEEMKSDEYYNSIAGEYYKSWSGYFDELSWAGAWLYKATADKTYLSKAETYAQQFPTEGQSTDVGYKWAHSWDDVHQGAALLLAELTQKDDYKAMTENHLDYWTTGHNGDRIDYTPKGLAWLSSWGSLRYASTTAFLASVYAESDLCTPSKVDTYNKFAKSQADYILGSTGRSFLAGFGVNPPTHPHHRTAHGAWENNMTGQPQTFRHTLVGALVGGPDANDKYNDSITDYVCNEVACDYNAGLVGLLAQMYDDFGGQIDPNLNAIEEVGEELSISASINSKDSTNRVNYVEIKAVVKNTTAWPARVTDKLSFRYFVDISDVLAAGYKASDMVTKSSYSQNKCTVSNLQPWDEENGIYYVDVDLSGAKIYPGGQSEHKSEVQFRITAPGKWDFTQSPSYQGLASTSANNMVKATNMALYDDGKLVFGQEPGSGVVKNSPTIQLTAPKNGATYTSVTTSNPIKMSATAKVEGSQISKVAFYVDGTKIAEDTTAPYTAEFVPQDVANKQGETKAYTVSAVAYAANGKSTTSSESTIKVTLPFTEVAVPTVKMTAPSNHATIDMSNGVQAMTLAADASIKNSSIQKVVFYVNGEQVGESTSAPFKTTYTPSGTASKKGELTSYTMKAEAFGANGTSKVSEPIKVNVQLPVVEKPVVSAPTISITSPSNGTKYQTVGEPVKVTVAADAKGDTVSKVEFYADGRKFAEATKGSNGVYEATYTPSGTVNKDELTPVKLTAKVMTKGGQSAEAKAVTVYVQLKVNQQPEDVDVMIEVTNKGGQSKQTNTIRNNLKIVNKSNESLDLSKLTIRYYYTADGNQKQSFWCDHAAVQMNVAPWYKSYKESAEGQVVALSNGTSTADSYMELRFNANDLLKEGATLIAQTRVAKSDWSNYDQTNDFSYGDTRKVAVYYDGQLVAGMEP